MNTPKRLNIFVEGQTELIFLTKLISKLAQEKKLKLTNETLFGGKRFTRIAMTNSVLVDSTDPDYIVQIICSMSDGRVTSDLKDALPTMIASGVDAAFAVRDVFPNSNTDITQIRSLFHQFLGDNGFNAALYLATRETEAWFLAERSHFLSFDNSLNQEKVVSAISCEKNKAYFEARDYQNIDHPAFVLNEIYNVAGKNWDKSNDAIEFVTDRIDLSAFYGETMEQFADLKKMKDFLDEFFKLENEITTSSEKECFIKLLLKKLKPEAKK